jgi:uridine kinase
MAVAPHLIGIAGPSCAGKTQLAHWLAARLEAPVVNLDHYYVDSAGLSLDERAQRNFDEPAALEHKLIIEHALALGRGEVIRAPQYDFATHTRTAAEHWIAPAPFVILEGLFALYWPALREALHTRLFVDAPAEVCLARRLARDVAERGRTPESVRRQFDTTVLPMAQLHVLPTRRYADLILSGIEAVEALGQRVLARLALCGAAWHAGQQ